MLALRRWGSWTIISSLGSLSETGLFLEYEEYSRIFVYFVLPLKPRYWKSWAKCQLDLVDSIQLASSNSSTTVSESQSTLHKDGDYIGITRPQSLQKATKPPARLGELMRGSRCNVNHFVGNLVIASFLVFQICQNGVAQSLRVSKMPNNVINRKFFEDFVMKLELYRKCLPGNG